MKPLQIRKYRPSWIMEDFSVLATSEEFLCDKMRKLIKITRCGGFSVDNVAYDGYYPK